MQKQIETLINDIVNDYANWQERCSVAAGETEKSQVKKDMFAKFKNGVTYKEGSKYVKIFNEGGSVWGFVVNTDNDKKFKKGDIIDCFPANFSNKNFY